MNEFPPWARRLGAAAVAIVALVAAVVSYAHMHQLAAQAGEGWRAWLEPLSVDGLLIGSSLVLMTRRDRRWLAWLAVVAGLVVSLAANLAVAEPGVWPHLVAGWPAVALALSYETLLSLARPVTTRQRPVVDQAEPEQSAAFDTSPHQGVTNPPGEPGEPLVFDIPRDVAKPGFPDPFEPVDIPAPARPASLLDQARQVVHQARQEGDDVGRIRLAQALDVSEHKARQLLAEVNGSE